MRATLRPTSLALLFTLLITVLPVTASRIPLGIRADHGIFLQEIWQGDQPFLCVANQSALTRTLHVSRWMSRQVAAQPLLEWTLAADSASCHDASALVGEALLAFNLDGGKLLGLLRGPMMPNAQRPATSRPASYLGPNGTCPTPGVWIEQPTLWLRAGEPATLDLWIRVADKKTHIEFPADSGWSLPQFHVLSATSSTLNTDQAGERMLITSGQDNPAHAVQHARLIVDVPEVTAPTMFLLSGRKRIEDSGWQCLLRALMVAPR